MKVLLLLLTAFIVNTFGIPAPESDVADSQDDEILFSLDGLAFDEGNSLGHLRFLQVFMNFQVCEVVSN
jgi:hypothetical protein